MRARVGSVVHKQGSMQRNSLSARARGVEMKETRLAEAHMKFLFSGAAQTYESQKSKAGDSLAYCLLSTVFDTRS